MARRVFFHIGAPKTGTTFLQAVMWANRDTLRRQGVLFPGDWWLDRVWATNIVRETANVPHERARTSWKRIVAQTKRFDGTVVISHEFFSAASREQAAKAIAAVQPAEVHVVYTARDFVRQVPALWQEQLKFRLTTPLSEFEPEPLSAGPRSHFGWRTLDVVDALDRWGRDMPPERVHVVTVPPSGAPPGLLWQRFATLCGIDPDSCDTDLGRANESLGSVEAELLRRVNPRISNEIRGPREVPTWVRDYLGHAVLVPHGGSRFGVSPKRADELREMSRESIRRLDLAGYDVVGDLKELIPPDDLPETRQPEDATEAELLDAALDTIAVMLKNHRDVAKDRNKWRAKARRLEQRHGPEDTLVRRVRRGLGRARRAVRAQVRKRL
ncbi:MAG: hypothetical protein ACRDO0_17890 [Nocardioidaceae bacterium]